MNKAEIFGLLFFALICCGALVCAVLGIGSGAQEPESEALSPTMKRIEAQQSHASVDSTRVRRKTKTSHKSDSLTTKRDQRSRRPDRRRSAPVPRERDYVGEQ